MQSILGGARSSGNQSDIRRMRSLPIERIAGRSADAGGPAATRIVLSSSQVHTTGGGPDGSYPLPKGQVGQLVLSSVLD